LSRVSQASWTDQMGFPCGWSRVSGYRAHSTRKQQQQTEGNNMSKTLGGHVGENGLKPDTKYRLEFGNWKEVN
jgi:hypothetical protein